MNNNCTTFAVGVMKYCNIEPIISSHKWIIANSVVENFFTAGYRGYSPADVGEDICKLAIIGKLYIYFGEETDGKGNTNKGVRWY